MSTANIFTPIGLVVPFVNGKNGYFEQSFDTNTQVKNNLTNFLRTRRGERRMMPEFGTKLYELIFEQYDNNIEKIAKNILVEEITQWIPQISVQEIIINNAVNSGAPDNYILHIVINYVVKSTKKKDTLQFNIQNGRL